MKQVFDFALGLVLVLVLAPVMLVVGILIRATSPGPALFTQTRLGRHKRPYTLYKFRTMHIDTPDVATHEVGRSAVTKVGAFLRRTKLDELPQLLNVIRGEMSFVGPRPCLPSQEHIVAMREAGGVWELKPGITGISQVNGVVMDEPERLVDMDIEYRRTRSFVNDLRLMVRTVLGAGQGDRVK